MRELKYPAIYRHFKNKYYATMGESEAISLNKLKQLIENAYEEYDFKIYTTHTEKGEDIQCYFIGSKWYHCDMEDKSRLVIYKSLYDGSGAYTRPIDMFLSDVDKEKYPYVEQKYRFEIVR